MRNIFITVAIALATQASAACTRETLKAITDAHLAAQIAGQTSFATNATYTQNRKNVDIKSCVLSKALKIDHARAQHDVPQCAAFTEFISTNAAAPYVIATQIRVDNTSNAVVQLDSIVTTKGDWLFNVTGTYYWTSVTLAPPSKPPATPTATSFPTKASKFPGAHPARVSKAACTLAKDRRAIAAMWVCRVV
jgi:hypothetical protein